MNNTWMKRLLSLLLVSVLFLAFFDGKNILAERATIDVTLHTYFDSENVVETTGLSGPYGTTLNFETNVASQDNYSFAYWIVNDAVEKSYLVDHEFILIAGISLVAVFSPNDEYVGVFRDSNLQVLNIKYANSAASFLLVDSDVPQPDKPGYVVDNPKWDSSLTLSANTVLTLQYTFVTADTYDITVNGGSSLGPVSDIPFDTVLAVQANEPDPDEYFQYWEVNGEIVSYNTVYQFTVLEDKTLTAVFDTVVQSPAPVVSLSTDMFLRSGYYSFLGQLYIPDGFTLVEFGMLTSTTVLTPTLDDGTSTIVSGTTYLADTLEYLMSFSTEIASIRSYMVVDNGVDEPIVFYSSVYDIPYEIFISEYIEGSGNNKAIELYNPTSASMTLINYDLAIYNSAATTPNYTYALDSITIPAYSTYVIVASTSANQEMKDQSDAYSSVANFNGDDAIALLKNDVIIDLFGKNDGNDPGTSWTFDDGATAEYTLVRDSSVTTPSATWNTDEWIVYDQDTFGFLGLHFLIGHDDTGARPSYSGAVNATITEGDTYNPLTGVSADDYEDGDISGSITYTVYDGLDVEVSSPGDFDELSVDTYSIEYSVTDSDGNAVIKITTLTILAQDAGPTLFFSEYGEPDGGTCKYVEIYNPTDASVDLSNYSIKKGTDGADFSTSFSLSGTLASGGVLVVRSSTCTSLTDGAQTEGNPDFPLSGLQELEATIMSFNGDDALGLFEGDLLIDVIGTTTEGDPGTGFALSPSGKTVNTILIRKSTVTTGSTNWDDGKTQWNIQADDRDYSNVGLHTCDLPE